MWLNKLVNHIVKDEKKGATVLERIPRLFERASVNMDVSMSKKRTLLKKI